MSLVYCENLNGSVDKMPKSVIKGKQITKWVQEMEERCFEFDGENVLCTICN